MYEPLYSTYCGKIGIEDRRLSVDIVPRFGTTCTKFEIEKVYWCVDNEILKDETDEKRELLFGSETRWVITVNNDGYFCVYVTEYTKTIKTSFGKRMNQLINRKIKQAQEEYRKEKETQKRLYFYDAEKAELTLYVSNTKYFNDIQYALNRPFVLYEAIDKRYSRPTESCFILGKIQRTIGTKDGKLMDFIEPIAEFKLDEEKWWLYEKDELGDKIFLMLQFSILKKEPTGLPAARIQNKMGYDVKKFLKELNTALEEGDVEKIKKFYDVIDEPQSCSGKKFQILEKGEILCCGDKWLLIRYENEEENIRRASWIAENIARCSNKKVIYLEEKGQYKFY